MAEPVDFFSKLFLLIREENPSHTLNYVTPTSIKELKKQRSATQELFSPISGIENDDDISSFRLFILIFSLLFVSSKIYLK
jgi:hypothetical protein